MKLSGTPNEKALIALCAYIIGFTTAYIFYFQLEDISSSITSSQTATVVQTLESEQVTTTNESEVQIPDTTERSAVYYEDGRLLVETIYSESPTLLSISSDRFGDEDITLEQGVHLTRPSFVHFSDRDLVLFCESVDVSGNCNLFLYDIENERLQTIRDMSGDIATYNTRLQLPVTYDDLITFTQASNLTF